MDTATGEREFTKAEQDKGMSVISATTDFHREILKLILEKTISNEKEGITFKGNLFILTGAVSMVYQAMIEHNKKHFSEKESKGLYKAMEELNKLNLTEGPLGKELKRV